MDSALMDPDSFRNSIVFADDWFGDGNADNDMHTVTTGRFAYVPVMQNAVNFSRVYNPFGLLRSPVSDVW